MTPANLQTTEKRINDVLTRVELFNGLSQDELNALASVSQIKTYPRATMIYTTEMEIDRVYFVMQGMVKIGTFSSDGREVIKHILQPFDMFGELALTGVANNGDFAGSLKDPVEVLRVPVEMLKSLMVKHPDMIMRLMASLATRIRRTERRLEELVHNDARGRLVAFIREQAERNGVMFGTETLVRHGLTHQEISNITGTSRQLITIVLNQMRRENLINFDRSTILVRDIKNLA
jgi:CRP/FNR family cyclic AMP-dependent transcriptional regulator